MCNTFPSKLHIIWLYSVLYTCTLKCHFEASMQHFWKGALRAQIYRVSINSDTDWAAICGQTVGVRNKSVFSFFFGHKKLYKNMLLYSIYRQPFSHSSLETNTHKILWHVFDQCKSERWITFIFSNSTFKVQHFIWCVHQQPCEQLQNEPQHCCKWHECTRDQFFSMLVSAVSSDFPNFCEAWHKQLSRAQPKWSNPLGSSLATAGASTALAKKRSCSHSTTFAQHLPHGLGLLFTII